MEEEPSTSGRPFERSHKPEISPDSWTHSRLGLMESLDPVAVWFAIMTESTEALLSLCSNLVRFPPNQAQSMSTARASMIVCSMEGKVISQLTACLRNAL